MTMRVAWPAAIHFARIYAARCDSWLRSRRGEDRALDLAGPSARAERLRAPASRSRMGETSAPTAGAGELSLARVRAARARERLSARLARQAADGKTESPARACNSRHIAR